jgi:hypothetical protein
MAVISKVCANARRVAVRRCSGMRAILGDDAVAA